MEETQEKLLLRESLKNSQSTRDSLTLAQLLILAPLVMPVQYSGNEVSFNTTNVHDTLKTIVVSTSISIDEQLAETIFNIHNTLLAQQKDIDPDCRETLYSNLWDLYS